MKKRFAGGRSPPQLFTVGQLLDAIASYDPEAPMTFIADGDDWAVKRIQTRSGTRGRVPDETMSIGTVRRALQNLEPETAVELLIGDQEWTISGIHSGQRLVIAARQTQGDSA